MRVGALGLMLLLFSGCAAAAVVVPMALVATLGAVGIYQRWEDRGTQERQTAEIKKLREEITRLRDSRAAEASSP